MSRPRAIATADYVIENGAGYDGWADKLMSANPSPGRKVLTAAVAERLTTRPPLAIALSVVFSLLFTWAGLAVAFYTPYPVSFFITSLAFGTYVVVRAVPVIGLLATHVRKRLAQHPVITEHISLVAFPKQETR
jgi:zinc/manganese transport system permease protein